MGPRTPRREWHHMIGTTAARRTCKGTTKAGNPCRSTLVLGDGYCAVHSPSKPFDLVELGRAGGIASGEVRRALANTARERLRRLADEDEEFWLRLKAAYKDGLEAVADDGSPDYRTRVMTAGAFLAEAYGKPPQAIIGDDTQPLQFVLESPFRRGSDESAD
jgi:hypothetical protein